MAVEPGRTQYQTDKSFIADNSQKPTYAVAPGAKKITSILGAIFLLIVLLIGLVILFTEPIVKYLVEGRGSAALGRELRIEGDLDIRWHTRHTRVNAKKIRLANAKDYEEPHMVAIEELEFSINPLQMLRGKLELGVITINQPIIILEQKTPEENNWTFSSSTDDETVDNNDRRAFPVIERLQITDGKLFIAMRSAH